MVGHHGRSLYDEEVERLIGQGIFQTNNHSYLLIVSQLTHSLGPLPLIMNNHYILKVL